MAKAAQIQLQDSADRAPSTTALREAWLSDLAALMAPEFERLAGVKLPAYAVTCGFPSRGGELGRKKRTMGQCWAAVASEAKRAEIFISPVEEDPRVIAAVLAHELVHAIFPAAGHGGAFITTARKLGHVRPFTAMTEETLEGIWTWAAPLVAQLPDYPHKRLNALTAVGARKKQSSRLLKASCKCGYNVRVTRKWVDELGAPHCPQDGEMTVEGLGEEEDGE